MNGLNDGKREESVEKALAKLYKQSNTYHDEERNAMMQELLVFTLAAENPPLASISCFIWRKVTAFPFVVDVNLVYHVMAVIMFSSEAPSITMASGDTL